MKKIVIIVTILLGLNSCDNKSKEKNTNSKILTIENISSNYNQNYDVYMLDGCEYIVVGYGNSKWGSHKGDCLNHPSCNSDSLLILKNEIKDIKKYVKKLEEDNKMMGSYLGYYDTKYNND